MSVNKYFKVLPNMLSEDDTRYIKWRESLKKRPPTWCKGVTKDMDIRVKKISDTFKRKKIDNFAKWRHEARISGLIPSSYPSFEKCPKLAFLIGMILGDGHLHRFPRTEKLELALGTDKPKLIKFAKSIIDEVFSKESYIFRPKGVNMVKITLYQKYISKRLKIPLGNRGRSEITIPKWIWEDDKNLLAYLRGLFEAEGSLSIHLPTYTYNFAFSNTNPTMLNNVCISLKKFGFHPEVRQKAIRLRKKGEVFKFKELISFRNYHLL